MKVQLCIVFTHVSCHRLRLCIYIYIYSYVYYIFIYLTLVDPCTCGNEQGGKQNRSDFALSETRTLRREHNSHTTQARTHTRKQSQVFDTQVCTQVESYSKSLRGKWGRMVCSKGRLRHTERRIRWLTVNGHLPAHAQSRQCGTRQCIECTVEHVKGEKQCRPRIHAYDPLTLVRRRMEAVPNTADGPTREER